MNPPEPQVYGLANCDTVKPARAWLVAQGVSHHFHDFKKLGVQVGTEWPHGLCSPAPRSNCIDDGETKDSGESCPTAYEGHALRGPPLEDCTGTLNAKKWRDDSDDDDEGAEDAKDPWGARDRCDAKQDKANGDPDSCRDIEPDWRYREPRGVQENRWSSDAQNSYGSNDETDGDG